MVVSALDITSPDRSGWTAPVGLWAGREGRQQRDRLRWSSRQRVPLPVQSIQGIRYICEQQPRGPASWRGPYCAVQFLNTVNITLSKGDFQINQLQNTSPGSGSLLPHSESRLGWSCIERSCVFETLACTHVCTCKHTSKA